MSIKLAGLAEDRDGALADGPAAEPTLRGNRLAEQYGVVVPGFDPNTPIQTQADRDAAKAAAEAREAAAKAAAPAPISPAEAAGLAGDKPASDAKPAGDVTPGREE